MTKDEHISHSYFSPWGNRLFKHEWPSLYSASTIQRRRNSRVFLVSCLLTPSLFLPGIFYKGFCLRHYVVRSKHVRPLELFCLPFTFVDCTDLWLIVVSPPTLVSRVPLAQSNLTHYNHPAAPSLSTTLAVTLRTHGAVISLNYLWILWASFHLRRVRLFLFIPITYMFVTVLLLCFSCFHLNRASDLTALLSRLLSFRWPTDSWNIAFDRIINGTVAPGIGSVIGSSSETNLVSGSYRASRAFFLLLRADGISEHFVSAALRQVCLAVLAVGRRSCACLGF